MYTSLEGTDNPAGRGAGFDENGTQPSQPASLRSWRGSHESLMEAKTSSMRIEWTLPLTSKRCLPFRLVPRLVHGGKDGLDEWIIAIADCLPHVLR